MNSFSGKSDSTGPSLATLQFRLQLEDFPVATGV